MVAILKKLKNENKQFIERVKKRREELNEISKQRKREIKLAIDFSKQHLSVSKALQRHEFLSMLESRAKRNTVVVEARKTQEVEQKEVVRRYIEKRNLIRLVQAANEREWIEAKIQEDSKSSHEMLRNRVESYKSVREETKKRNTLKPASATTILFYDFTEY